MSAGPRFLQTMLRVGNLDASVRFYTELLGMQELRRRVVPEGKFTLVFLGYGDEATTTVLGLTYNEGVDRYEKGNGFRHIGIGVPDVSALCDRLRTAGVKITREPGAMRFGDTVIAFIEDPDSYVIELIQRT